MDLLKHMWNKLFGNTLLTRAGTFEKSLLPKQKEILAPAGSIPLSWKRLLNLFRVKLRYRCLAYRKYWYNYIITFIHNVTFLYVIYYNIDYILFFNYLPTNLGFAWIYKLVNLWLFIILIPLKVFFILLELLIADLLINSCMRLILYIIPTSWINRGLFYNFFISNRKTKYNDYGKDKALDKGLILLHIPHHPHGNIEDESEDLGIHHFQLYLGVSYYIQWKYLIWHNKSTLDSFKTPYLSQLFLKNVVFRRSDYKQYKQKRKEDAKIESFYKGLYELYRWIVNFFFTKGGVHNVLMRLHSYIMYTFYKTDLMELDYGRLHKDLLPVIFRFTLLTSLLFALNHPSIKEEAVILLYILKILFLFWAVRKSLNIWNYLKDYVHNNPPLSTDSYHYVYYIRLKQLNALSFIDVCLDKDRSILTHYLWLLITCLERLHDFTRPYPYVSYYIDTSKKKIIIKNSWCR